MSNFLVTGTSPDDYDEPKDTSGHVWYEHNDANPCSYQGGAGCPYCDGGLSLCTVCGLTEGSLTTNCPGRKVTEAEEKEIYENGTLDYRDGQWVNEGSPHSPATHRNRRQRPQIAGVDW